MPDQPLAYHITVGTYGTRLHGDERGTVDRRHNTFGEPILGMEVAWEQVERTRLKFPPRILTVRQRHHAEVMIPSICERGKWKYHIAAVRPDHFHVLLSAEADGQVVRRLFKRWLSEELSKFWQLQEDEVWWAECGSVKWVWDEWYFNNVYRYIVEQKSIRGDD